jgi:gamma-glutamyl-gamma-aminobutyrate hydrolase PuuD
MKIDLHCTDKNQYIEAEILNIRESSYLEAVIQNSIKLHMQYNSKHKTYIGSMGGLEFTIKEDNIPNQHSYKPFKRTR